MGAEAMALITPPRKVLPAEWAAQNGPNGAAADRADSAPKTVSLPNYRRP
jgi:hypothetical protein